MKKLLFITLLIPAILFSESFLISNIPLPQTSVEDLDPYECDEYCMQEYVDNDMIFSFLAHAKGKLQNSELNQVKNIYTSLLNTSKKTVVQSSGELKIAIMSPYKKIGKYAASTMNATFAYLLHKNHPYELKSYNLEDESQESILAMLEQIQMDGISYVIAPLTQEGATNLAMLDTSLNIFIPTVHKKQVDSNSTNIYFGAVDYESQCDALQVEVSSPLVIFSDKSVVGKHLSLYEADNFKYDENNFAIPNHRVYQYFLPKKVTNLEYYLKKNKRIAGGVFFINTPVIKTSMIMSQLTLYDVGAKKILSTQVNYNPLVLVMTQYADRKNMLIANSITEHNDDIIEMNALLENDIEYDWINYTTTVGVDYFYSLMTGDEREYKMEISDNQVNYPVEIMQPMYAKFQHYYTSSSKSDFMRP